MTIIDTSVWIEFFEGGDHWTKERLKQMLQDRESIAYVEKIKHHARCRDLPRSAKKGHQSA